MYDDDLSAGLLGAAFGDLGDAKETISRLSEVVPGIVKSFTDTGKAAGAAAGALPGADKPPAHKPGLLERLTPYALPALGGLALVLAIRALRRRRPSK